jgi:hypothetical protein
VIRHDILVIELAARIGGLDKTSQQGGRFGQRPEDSFSRPQRGEPALELRPLDGVGGERDRPLVCARRGWGVAGPPERAPLVAVAARAVAL